MLLLIKYSLYQLSQANQVPKRSRLKTFEMKLKEQVSDYNTSWRRLNALNVRIDKIDTNVNKLDVDMTNYLMESWFRSYCSTNYLVKAGFNRVN